MLKVTILHLAIYLAHAAFISSFPANVVNSDAVLRYRREAADTESTTPYLVTDPTSDVQTGYQEIPTDTNLNDPGNLGHHQGDRSHGSAFRGQGEINGSERHTSYHSDYQTTSEYGPHQEQHDFYSAIPEHGLKQENTGDITIDHHNALQMTRPGEKPPRFMRIVQNEHKEPMPEALPLTQEPPASETGLQDVQTDTAEGVIKQQGQTDGTESGMDIPRALPQTQDPGTEVGRPPLALPQKQGRAKPKSRPTSNPPKETPSQGQQPRPKPRPRPRPRPQETSRQGVRGSSRDPARDLSSPVGSDVLATAAILNSDVQDTMVDGMEMIAKQRAIEQLDRQLSGSNRDQGGPNRPLADRGRTDIRGRTPPDWGGDQQASAPRRNGRPSHGHADPLDTLARVHAVKNHADMVQDHVDTVQDVHQDQYDYMTGGRDYDPHYQYRYDRYNSRYDHGYDRYNPRNPPRDHNNRNLPRDHNYRNPPRDRNYRNGRFPSDQNFGARQQYDPYPQYPPYNVHGGDRHYYRGDEDRGYGYDGYQPGLKIDINTGLPCSNLSDPQCQMRMNREIQIETPHGELDMEPGEMDLEGAAAADLLKMLGIVQSPGVAPIHQEININHNVLAALKSRFGVNSTAGIRRMSSNPDFQAFMYRVLTHSAPVAPGEYNANLTRAEVDRLLVNLDASRSRLNTANLDHAKLNINNPPAGENKTSQSEAVLTLDGAPGSNPAKLGVPLLGNIPGLTSPLVQNGQLSKPGAVAQPGSVAALVQTMLGGSQTGEDAVGGEPSEGHTINGTLTSTIGGETGEGREGHQINTTQAVNGEAGEASEATEGQEKLNNETTSIHNSTRRVNSPETNTTARVSMTAPQQQKGAAVSQTSNNTKVFSNAGLINGVIAQQVSQNKSIIHNETETVGKEHNPKLSKDHITKITNNETKVDTVTGTRAGSAAGAGSGSGSGTTAGVGGTGGGAGTGAVTGKSGAGAGSAQGGGGNEAAAAADTRPIGLAEAGIDPGSQALEPTSQIPAEAIERGYKASTAFAIASATLIALAIIVGPILCLLCKMKEKSDQRKRKEKAMKNRDVSENSIMDAMMLHEFGPEAPNFVANEAQAAMNYYKTDRVYSTINHDITELESLKSEGRSPYGHLP